MAIALVDEQLFFREGFKALAATDPELQVVGEAGDAREAYSLVDNTRPDVVVIDVQLPDAELWYEADEGQIKHAAYGSLKGDEAVYKALTWPTGNFQIDFEGRSTEQTTTRSTQGLLMEGLRLVDEAGREAKEDVLDT